MKLLGIDYGASKIGIAIGDSESKVALPLKIIKNQNNLFLELAKLCQKEKIEKIIIGLPQNTQAGKTTTGEKKARQFAADLSAKLKLPVELISEIFTTQQANKILAGGQKKADDDVAAMLILQEYLDSF